MEVLSRVEKPRARLMQHPQATFRTQSVLPVRKQLWLWPHLLSLDAPAVAVVWQLLFARAFDAHPAPMATTVMALVIWLIYVGDRILDSYRITEGESQALRHQFYQAHRLAFAVPVFAVLAAAAWISYHDLGFRIRRDGLLLASVVAAYFLFVHTVSAKIRRWFPKELVVALVFGAGTMLPVAIRIRRFTSSFVILAVLFVLVLWLNTLLIEYSEWITLRGSAIPRPHPTTLLAGRHFVIFGLCVVILALSVMLAHASMTRFVSIAEALSALSLAALGASWRRIPSYAVDMLADLGVLIPPLVLLLLWR